MQKPTGREAQIINERKKKALSLKEAGFDPYTNRFELMEKRVFSEDIKKEFEKLKKEENSGKKRVLAGRIMTKRAFGKLNFASIQDLKGNIQIVIQKGSSPEETVSLFKKCDSGDIIGVEGEVIKTKTGEVSLLVSQLFILTKSIYPLPDKHSGLKDEEEKLRKRYLDIITNDPRIRKFCRGCCCKSFQNTSQCP
jgi:lysyl-tRNA synthetase class 2